MNRRKKTNKIFEFTNPSTPNYFLIALFEWVNLKTVFIDYSYLIPSALMVNRVKKESPIFTVTVSKEENKMNSLGMQKMSLDASLPRKLNSHAHHKKKGMTIMELKLKNKLAFYLLRSCVLFCLHSFFLPCLILPSLSLLFKLKEIVIFCILMMYKMPC